MLERAARLGCVLRPHVKTAKTLQAATIQTHHNLTPTSNLTLTLTLTLTLQAATIQTGGTKRRVVVSTLAEAEFLASGAYCA